MNIEKLTKALYENRIEYTTAFYENDAASKFYHRLSNRVFHKPMNDGSEESKERYKTLKEVCKELYGVQLKTERRLYEIEEQFDGLIDNFDNE